MRSWASLGKRLVRALPTSRISTLAHAQRSPHSNSKRDGHTKTKGFQLRAGPVLVSAIYRCEYVRCLRGAQGAFGVRHPASDSSGGSQCELRIRRPVRRRSHQKPKANSRAPAFTGCPLSPSSRQNVHLENNARAGWCCWKLTKIYCLLDEASSGPRWWMPIISKFQPSSLIQFWFWAVPLPSATIVSELRVVWPTLNVHDRLKELHN